VRDSRPLVFGRRPAAGTGLRPAAAPPTPPLAGPAKLRLFLCQRNERELLRPWLRHALALVDAPSDVTVVDDCSGEEDVVAALREAEAAGVRVQWVRPPQLPAFRRKHLMFTQWVQSYPAAEAAFYVPLDCDEFLAARRRLPGLAERVPMPSGLLVVNTEVSGSREQVRQVLDGTLLRYGPGTWTIKRMRNFSHRPGLFADTREHIFCGSSDKIVVCGGGALTLAHATAVPNRGYHKSTTGRQFGVTHALCLVEFHNMPFAVRQRKSLQMLRVVPSESRSKYRTEGTCSRKEYETQQERAAHLQPCARSEEFAALMAHVKFDGPPSKPADVSPFTTPRPLSSPAVVLGPHPAITTAPPAAPAAPFLGIRPSQPIRLGFSGAQPMAEGVDAAAGVGVTAEGGDAPGPVADTAAGVGLTAEGGDAPGPVVDAAAGVGVTAEGGDVPGPVVDAAGSEERAAGDVHLASLSDPAPAPRRPLIYRPLS
jgi:hypothetical protein